MTEQTSAIEMPAASTTRTRSFTLDSDVTVNGTVVVEAGTEVQVRKPTAGELRGLTVNALLNGDVTQLLTLAPRVTAPAIPKGADMDPADVTQFAGEVVDFLLPRAARAALPTT